jgi:hypothetical protein
MPDVERIQYVELLHDIWLRILDFYNQLEINFFNKRNNMDLELKREVRYTPHLPN